MNSITLVEALGIVEKCGRQEMSQFFSLAAIALLTLAATVTGVYGVYLTYRKSRKAGASIMSSLFFAAYTLCVAWARNDSNKPTPTPSAHIRFDKSLYDAGSVATNDYPVIRWNYDPWIAGDVLHIDARPKGSTNDADWVQYHVGRVTEKSWTGYMPCCTGMVVYVWSEYVQPPAVYTNGVYHLDYLSAPLDREQETEDHRTWCLIRTPIFDAEEKRLMSPPSLPAPITIDIPQDLINGFINNEQERKNEN